MSDNAVTVLIVVVAFAVLAWPRLRRVMTGGRGLPPDQVKARLDGGEPTLLVDVREPAELENEGRIDGAINIPLPQLARRVDEITSQVADRPETGVVIVCRSGARAEHAMTILAAAGLKKITPLKGGIRGWIKAGLPTA